MAGDDVPESGLQRREIDVLGIEHHRDVVGGRGAVDLFDEPEPALRLRHRHDAVGGPGRPPDTGHRSAAAGAGEETTHGRCQQHVTHGDPDAGRGQPRDEFHDEQ